MTISADALKMYRGSAEVRIRCRKKSPELLSQPGLFFRSRSPTSGPLVPVVVRLVRAVDRHAEVVGLFLRQLRQLHAEVIEVQPRHLLVEVLRQHVDLLLVLAGVRVQLELRDHLVGERRRHHEARVAGRAAEVQQPAFGEHHHAVAVGEAPLVVLRLDVDPLDARELLQAGHVDLVVEVADVADDRLVLHLRHVVGGDDVEVAGRGDEDVGASSTHVLERVDLVAFHRRLQRADRIDLGDDDAAALAAQRLRAALADFAEAEDDRDLAAEHDVGRAREAVGQRVAAAVDVVELALGDRVVDVDGREEQRAGFHHLIEAVHAGRRLFADAADGRRRAASSGDLSFAIDVLIRSRMTPHSSGSLVGVERRHLAGLLELGALVHDQRRVAAVVDDQRRAAAVRPLERFARAPPVLVERLALPREHRHALRVLRPCRRFRDGRRRPPRPRDPASRRCCTRPSARRRRARPASR